MDFWTREFTKKTIILLRKLKPNSVIRTTTTTITTTTITTTIAITIIIVIMMIYMI